MTEKPVAAGKSSFDLIDKEKAFEIISLRQDSTFLDLACGIGKYSIEIARMIGVNGTVYAVDLWQEGIEALRQEIGKRKMKNVKTLLADITKELPLKEGSIDACLMATILHDLSRDARGSALREVGRLLKPGGMLTVIEFKRIDEGPGPPIDIRIEEEELESLVTPYGFAKVAASDIGHYNYLSKFRKIGARGNPIER